MQLPKFVKFFDYDQEFLIEIPLKGEMKPYNKINHKMENFFIKKTSFCEPSAEILNNEIKLFEEFLIVGVNKNDFEKKLQPDDNRIKITFYKFFKPIEIKILF